MPDVQGIVTADSSIKVRSGPHITDGSGGLPIPPGTAVTITGFAIDPRINPRSFEANCAVSELRMS